MLKVHCNYVLKYSLLHFLLSVCALPNYTCTSGITAGVLGPFVRYQTKYPCLTSSCVTAALLTLSLGLGPPPPRLEVEWTVRKSREGVDLESRTRDEDAVEAEVLDKSGCSRGSMTVLMTEEIEKCPQHGNIRN